MKKQTLLKIQQLKKCMKEPIHAINNYIRTTPMVQKEIQLVLRILNKDENIKLPVGVESYHCLAESLLYKMAFDIGIYIGFAGRCEADCDYFGSLLETKFRTMKKLFQPIMTCKTLHRIEFVNGSAILFGCKPTDFVGRRFDMLVLDYGVDEDVTFKGGLFPQLYGRLIRIVEDDHE